MSVANVSLNSFMESYKEELPLVESNEYRMMMSILGKVFRNFLKQFAKIFFSGVCVNISAQMQGREYVVNEDIGITFIENILKFLSAYPMPTGHLLKRMSLMFVFNVIILRRGARIVKASPNGIANVLGCLSPEHSNEVQTLVLDFVIFLHEQIPTEDLIQKIREAVDKVREIFFLFPTA